MSDHAAGVAAGVCGPSQERLTEVVRRGLDLSPTEPVTVREVGEFSNINYVYRVEVPGRTLYLKVVPERPKRLPIRLPRERVFSEAEGLRRFRSLAGETVTVPEVLFVDAEEMALAMSDVGEGRQVLYSLLPERFDLLVELAEGMGRALGRVHGGSRGVASPRPPQEEAIIRKVVFDGLLGPGAQLVFPESWGALSAEMQAHRQCLIHADLWSKNLLVQAGRPVALVDFEGTCCGDPAFDLGTLSAVALVPALDNPHLVPDALGFVSRMLHSWTAECGSTAWPEEVLPRTFRAVACFLAARAGGPFAYPLSDAGRRRIGGLARSLVADAPSDLDAFLNRVVQHAGTPQAG